MTIEQDEAFLDRLERKARHHRRRRATKPKPKTTRQPRARRQRSAPRGKLHGPPAPTGFKSAGVQAKAAEARKGLRNAAYSGSDHDAMCEGVKQILLTLRGGPQPSDSTIQAFTAWANNGGTKK